MRLKSNFLRIHLVKAQHSSNFNVVSKLPQFTTVLNTIQEHAMGLRMIYILFIMEYDHKVT